MTEPVDRSFWPGMPLVDIDAPCGRVRLRPQSDADRDFLFALFCASRPDGAMLAAAGGEPLMRMQFAAQTAGYRAQFPNARFDVVEHDGAPIGRLIVDRSGEALHLVDIALARHMRSRGVGGAILRALFAEANAARRRVRLAVASGNARALQFYLRLGFAPIATLPIHVELEWRPP